VWFLGLLILYLLELVVAAILTATAQTVTVVALVLPLVLGASNMLAAPVKAVPMATMVAPPQGGLRERVHGGVTGVEAAVAKMGNMTVVMGIGGVMVILVAATAVVGADTIHECSI
jgi:hypothetical protein